MSETIVEVTRKLTFWVGPPIDKIASNSRRPVDLFPGRPNSVSDEVLAEIAKDPRQGPIFDAYVQEGIIRDMRASDAQALVEGKRPALKPALTPTEQSAIDAGRAAKLAQSVQTK